MPSLGGSGEYGGSDVGGSSSSSGGGWSGGNSWGGYGSKAALDSAMSKATNAAGGSWGNVGSSGASLSDEFNARNLQRYTPNQVAGLLNAGLGGLIFGDDANSAARKYAKSNQVKAAQAVKQIAPQLSYLEQVFQAYPEYVDGYIDPETFNSKVAKDLDAQVRSASELTPEVAQALGALTELGPDTGYSIGKATQVANSLSSRGIGGSIRDALAEAFGAGYNRDISQKEFETRAKQGSLYEALSGLEQGVLETNRQGNLTADKVGQALDAFDSILGPLGLAAGSVLTGGLLGGTLGPTLVPAIGKSLAGSMLTSFTPSVNTVSKAAKGDYLGALATLSPIGEVAYDVNKLNELNTTLGLSQQHTPAIESTPLGESSIAEGVAKSTDSTVANNNYPLIDYLYSGYGFQPIISSPSYDRFGIRQY